jgi:hypothetical protein
VHGIFLQMRLMYRNTQWSILVIHGVSYVYHSNWATVFVNTCYYQWTFRTMVCMCVCKRVCALACINMLVFYIDEVCLFFRLVGRYYMLKIEVYRIQQIEWSCYKNGCFILPVGVFWCSRFWQGFLKILEQMVCL